MTLLAGNPCHYQYYLHAIVDNPHKTLDTNVTQGVTTLDRYTHNGATNELPAFYVSVMYSYGFNPPITVSEHYYLSEIILLSRS